MISVSVYVIFSLLYQYTHKGDNQSQSRLTVLQVWKRARGYAFRGHHHSTPICKLDALTAFSHSAMGGSTLHVAVCAGSAVFGMWHVFGMCLACVTLGLQCLACLACGMCLACGVCGMWHVCMRAFVTKLQGLKARHGTQSEVIRFTNPADGLDCGFNRKHSEFKNCMKQTVIEKKNFLQIAYYNKAV